MSAFVQVKDGTVIAVYREGLPPGMDEAREGNSGIFPARLLNKQIDGRFYEVFWDRQGEVYVQVMRERGGIGYAERRKAEYPPIEEQLDALWKGGDALEEMRQRVLGVKKRYPKQ